jgi:hypothetical protein
MFRKDPIKAVIEALKLNPEGLTLLSLAEVTGLHRHTCTKYIHELIGAGIVYQRDVGAAKLCYLNKEIENKEEENRIAEELKKKRKGKYHIKLLVAVVLFTFLLSETVIIAYDNSSLLNDTNFSKINTSPTTSTSNISNLSSFLNVSSEANVTENMTVEPPTVENLTGTVDTVENTNGSSNSQNNAENSTLEQVNLTENGTVSNVTDTNLTLNITNNTSSNETVETNITNETQEMNEISIEPPVIEPVLPEPKFDVKLLYPQKITRGKDIDIRAELMVDSFAKNIYLKWVLPQGMSVVSGNSIETCGDLNASSCISEISVKTDSSVIGLSEIKVVVSYEK